MEVGEDSPGRTPRSRQVGELRVHHESRVQQIVHTLIHRFERKQHKEVTLVASGNAIPTAILSAEAIRRRIPGIYQITSSTFETKDFPRTGTQSRIWSRRIPTLLIQLSTVPLDIHSPGYQAPLPLSEVNIHEEPVAFYDNDNTSFNSTSFPNVTLVPTVTFFDASDATLYSADISINYEKNQHNNYSDTNINNFGKGKSKNNYKKSPNFFSTIHKKKTIPPTKFLPSYAENFLPMYPLFDLMNSSVTSSFTPQLFSDQTPGLSSMISSLSAHSVPFVSQSMVSTSTTSTTAPPTLTITTMDPTQQHSSSSSGMVMSTVSTIQPISPLLSYNNTSIASLGSTVTLSPTSSHTLLSSSPSSSTTTTKHHRSKKSTKLRSESIPYTASSSNDNRSTVSSIYASSSYGVSTSGNYTTTQTTPSSQEISVHSNTSIASEETLSNSTKVVTSSLINICSESENNNGNTLPYASQQSLSRKKSYALAVQSSGACNDTISTPTSKTLLSSPHNKQHTPVPCSSTPCTPPGPSSLSLTKNKFLALSKINGKSIERNSPIISTSI